MAQLVFFEKPGCVGNRQQQAYLQTVGIDFEVRDLLSEGWTADSLRPFFGDEPVSEWFNQTAPAIKNAEIDRFALTEQQALTMMINNPILIKRPLMKVGEVYQSGFTTGPVLDLLGVTLDEEEDLQTCPVTVAG